MKRGKWEMPAASILTIHCCRHWLPLWNLAATWPQQLPIKHMHRDQGLTAPFATPRVSSPPLLANGRQQAAPCISRCSQYPVQCQRTGSLSIGTLICGRPQM